MSTSSYSLSESPFLNKVRRTIQLKHMSRCTEKSYLYYDFSQRSIMVRDGKRATSAIITFQDLLMS